MPFLNLIFYLSMLGDLAISTLLMRVVSLITKMIIIVNRGAQTRERHSHLISEVIRFSNLLPML